MSYTAEDYVKGIVPAGAMLKCPFHDDRNASATVMADTGRFWCFTCQTGGNQLDIARRLWFPDDPAATGYRLARLVIRQGHFPEVKPVPRTKVTDPVIYGMLERWVSACRSELLRHPNLAQEIKTTRGLQDVSALGLSGRTPFRELLAGSKEIPDWRHRSEELLHAMGLIYEDDPSRPRSLDERYRLGQRIIIPESREGRVVYYQARALPGDDTRAKYLNPRSDIDKPLFGLDSMANPSPCIWIVEGMFDLLPLTQANQSALALGGLGQLEQLMTVLRQYGKGRPVIIALDDDEPGQRMAVKRRQQLAEEGFDVHILKPPVHDLGDWVVRDGVQAVIEAGAELTWH